LSYPFTHYTIFDKRVKICYTSRMKQIITAKL